ncbi:hypothetical protein L6V77_12625 [Myxococcota bacterium]|nr:hypothetical protein [Myxococcota bacterium]
MMTAPHPETPRIDDEHLAALGEGRLLPAEEAAVIALLQQDDGARAAFRDLFPDRYAALFGCNVVDLPVASAALVPDDDFAAVSLPEPVEAPFPNPLAPSRPAWRLLGFGLVASFAVLAALVWPPRAPVHSTAVLGEAALAPPPLTRSVVRQTATEPAATVRPLFVDLGRPGRWDALRQRPTWAAVVVAAPGSPPAVLATSTRPGRCTVTTGTLGCLEVDTRPGAGVAVVVSTGAADARLDALVNENPSFDDLARALDAAAGTEPWTIHFPLASAARPD